MPVKSANLSVIVSTYQQPEWLRKALTGYRYQTVSDFEIIVADDGSDERTRAVIEEIQPAPGINLKHVWHEDDGFRKTVILNRAIEASDGEYLVFVDGDCIPRADFLEQHVRLREPGRFLSGGYFKLPRSISESITAEDIASQRCFDIDWLTDLGLPRTFGNNKLTATGWKASFLNGFTPTGATWNGMNASASRSDIIRVNGFDERMQYGGEDREMGERLVNLGIKGKQIRYSAICLHLHHDRSYVKPEMLTNNAAIRATTKLGRLTRTNYGIDKRETR